MDDIEPTPDNMPRGRVTVTGFVYYQGGMEQPTAQVDLGYTLWCFCDEQVHGPRRQVISGEEYIPLDIGWFGRGDDQPASLLVVKNTGKVAVVIGVRILTQDEERATSMYTPISTLSPERTLALPPYGIRVYAARVLDGDSGDEDVKAEIAVTVFPG